jgi:hypothetical protein
MQDLANVKSQTSQAAPKQGLHQLGLLRACKFDTGRSELKGPPGMS